MEQDGVDLGAAMWAVVRAEEQCARRIPEDGIADAAREEIRRLAARDGIKVRTARMGDTVVAARLDAKIWTEDAPTMRAKLTPPRDAS